MARMGIHAAVYTVSASGNRRFHNLASYTDAAYIYNDYKNYSGTAEMAQWAMLCMHEFGSPELT